MGPLYIKKLYGILKKERGLKSWFNTLKREEPFKRTKWV